MIDLYACGTPNVQKVLFFLGETDLPYNLKRMSLVSGDGQTPEFLALNPNGKVPVIVDPDGPGGKPYTVIESGAILMYLAEKTGQFWPTDMAKRYDMVQWLMWQMAGVGPLTGQAIHFMTYAPGEDQAYSRARYYTEVQRLAGVMETRLSKHAHIAGDDFSLADMALYPWTRNLPAPFGVKPEEHPHLTAWKTKMEMRPGWQKVKNICRQMLKEDQASTIAAPKDKIDRFLGRGAYSRV